MLYWEMIMRYREHDTIRLLKAQEGPGNYSQGEVHLVPAGAEGTILLVFDNAFEAEFTVREPEYDGDELVHPGSYHIITLTPDQVTPV